MIYRHSAKKHRSKKADKTTDVWKKALHFVNKFAEFLNVLIIQITLIALLLIVSLNLILSKLDSI